MDLSNMSAVSRRANLNSEEAAKLREQVEFYFSDSNVPRDKFLLSKIRAHPEGYVELAIICTFARVLDLLDQPHYQRPEKIPGEVLAKVASALADSTVLELCKEKDHVRRREPIKDAEQLIKEADARSIFSSPLPYDCTLESLTTFFSQVAPVRAIRMRRLIRSKDFRGSVFVEFASEKDAVEAVKRNDLFYEGAQQEMQLKSDYLNSKRQGDTQQEEEGGISKTEESLPDGTDELMPPTQGSPEDSTTAVEAEAEMAPEANSSAKRKADLLEGANNEPEAASRLKVEPIKPSYTPGLLVRLQFQENLEIECVHYNDIKTALGGSESGLRYIELLDENTALLRAKEPQRAKDILAKLKASPELKFGETTLHAKAELLSGCEEQACHDKANTARAAFVERHQEGHEGKGRRRKHFGARSRHARRGRGRGRGRAA